MDVINYEVGMEVIIPEGKYGDSVTYANYPGYLDKVVETPQIVPIKRVYSKYVLVNCEVRLYGVSHRDIVVSKDILTPADPSLPRPRRLGEVPEGALAANHPDLMWLWDDAAKVAKQRNLCSEYDTMCALLGIPGRPKEFSVKVTVNGFTGTVKVMARSQAEADIKVNGVEA